MRSFIVYPCLLLAGVLLLQPGRAGPAPASADVLTLTDALARAEQHNASLAAAGFQTRAAEGRIEQAGVRPNPTLELEAENMFGTGALEGVRGLETTIQASQTFERGDKRARRVAVARHERAAAELAYDVRRAEVLRETAIAFVEALASQERVDLASEPVRLAREVASAIQERHAAGAASPAEMARARSAVALAEVERERAEAALAGARARLRAFWSGDADEGERFSGALSVPDVLPEREALLANLDEHPRLAWQRALAEGLQATVALARAQGVPDVTVGGGVRFLREGSDVGLVAGVSVPLPIHDRNHGNVRAAREDAAAAEHGIRAVTADLRAEFFAAWQEMVAAHAAVHRLQRDVVPAIEEAHELVRRGYELGELPLIDVLEVQRELVSLRGEILDVRARFVLARVRIDALCDPEFSETSALLSSR